MGQPESSPKWCRGKSGSGVRAGSRRIWVASFLALAFIFGFGFLDESFTLPWIVASQAEASSSSSGWTAGDGDPDQLLSAASMTQEQERAECVSRTQHPLYLRSSRLFPMSEKLRLRLGEYEQMHRRCTEGRDWEAEIGNSTVQGGGGCQYLFFVENGGLGNRFLGVVSAFVYSLLTNRAILMSRSSNMSQLVCNPFEHSSWLAPLKFPQSKLLRMQVPLEDSSLQELSNVGVVKLKQQHGQKANDRRFYCTATQEKLAGVKWVTFDSNQYMIPRFFIMPYLWPQMLALFGDDHTLVFTHLSRYLLLPRNFVWDRILRIYWAYMADAGKRVGLQIRRHSSNFLFDQGAYDRVMQCAVQNGMVSNTTEVVPLATLTKMEPRPVFNLTSTLRRLSEQLLRVRTPITSLLGRRFGSGSTSPQNVAADSVEHGRPVSVLITSLNPEYYDEMKRQYGNNPTSDGSIVRVVQVTSDKSQSYDFGQLVDACTEMWLLALSDEIATSGWSTFGYIGHGIAGLEPYIVDLKGRVHRPGDPPCWRGGSREPCCHFPFLRSVCVDSVTNATEAGMSPEQAAWIYSHVQSCVDEKNGIQLVEHVDQPDERITRLLA